MKLALFGLLLMGCAELGVISDGSSVSIGKPSNGYLLHGRRIPNSGDGFFTREVWAARNNRFGTDELVDLLTAVAHRQHARVPDVRIVVADLSGTGGAGGDAFHRSHQSGRDADLLLYWRDPTGKPMEPDQMRVFDAHGHAKDGSGITIDVARTWLVVKDLITAPEANVQWIFMYQPIAEMLFEHAEKIGEPPELIARARLAVKQPSDSARHDDHMHVRVFCTPTDRALGCVDLGPRDMLEGWRGLPARLPQELGAIGPVFTGRWRP